MTITIQRWKYNNSEMRITKESERETLRAEGDTVAECMRKIQCAKFFNDMSKYTPFEIVNVED